MTSRCRAASSTTSSSSPSAFAYASPSPPTGRHRTPRGRPRAGPAAASRVRPGLDALLGSAFAIAFSLVAFVSTGGTGLGANTGQEIALMALGVGAGGAALVWRVPGARWGAGALALFGVLATLTALSIAWSV